MMLFKFAFLLKSFFMFPYFHHYNYWKDYEYKHKECKNEIDAIDNLLASIYDLTNDELSYIKSFALKYRMGSGADDKDN